MLAHLILERAGMRGKAQPVEEGREGRGATMRAPHQKVESFWCTKYTRVSLDTGRVYLAYLRLTTVLIHPVS